MATEQRQIRLRRDTTARWTQYNPVLVGGEMGVDVSNGDARLGTAGDVHYADLPSLAQFDIDGGDWAPAVKAAIDAYNDRRVPSTAYVLSGVGAAANIVRNTATNTSVIAFGRGAMASMANVKLGIAIGRNAQGNGTTTRDNIAVGDESLRNVNAGSVDYSQSDLSGTRNIGIGGNAGYFIDSGFLHTAIGRNAGSCLIGGQGATAVGGNALGGYAPIGFSGEIENWAPWGNGTDRIYTSAFGSNALQQNTASNNTAVGGDALKTNKRSDFNTAVGAQTMSSLDSSVGYKGGAYTTLNLSATYTWSGTTLVITASSHGFAAGDTAYIRLTSGGGQTFQGDVVPVQVASVTTSTVTITAPVSMTASGNALLVAREEAAQAPLSNSNTGVGALAGTALQSAGNVTLVGKSAYAAATSGSQQTAVGSNAMQFATSGSNSTAVGFWAAGSMTGDASQVTAVGASALRNRTDGNALTDDFTNVTGVGYDSRVSASNQVQLGNSSTTTYVYGTVQNRSDRRDKADIRNTVLGLDFINALRPVDYRWDMREDYLEIDEETGKTIRHKRDGSKKRERFHHGFVAQEVAQVIESTGVDFGGYQDHEKNGGAKVQSIGYDEIIAPLVKAVQQLTAKVEELEGKIADGNS